MLLLNSTDTLELVATAAGDLDVSSASMDWLLGTTTMTPHAPDPMNILAAGTTAIIGAPATGYVRNVRGLTVFNEAASANDITINRNNGTYLAALMSCTLQTMEKLVLDAQGVWHHYDAQGAEYQPSYLPEDIYSGAYSISGAQAESINRNLAGANLSALTSGTLLMQAIWLRKGQRVNNIAVCTGGTAGATMTHALFGLYDGSRNLLASSADGLSGALASNTVITKAMATPYTIPADGLYYVGVMVAATTVPTLVGAAAASNAAIRAAAPILSGTSNTGLTTALPSVANALTAVVNPIWVSVS